MTASDIHPSELLAALDTFIADRNMDSRGKAIRVLVTDMLVQIGYLPPVSAQATREDLTYRSSNGDNWLLVTTSDGTSVIHRANVSSGGKETITPVDQFLEQTGFSPEGEAVRAALNAESTP
jgi:hypothetical protein